MMKRTFKTVVLALLLTAAISVMGQQDSGVQVLNHEWKPNYRDSRLSNQPTIREPQQPVFQEPTLIRNRDGSNSINPNSQRVNPDGTPEPASATRLPAEKSIKAMVELKNDSTKKILSFEADFIFYDRNKKEYQRYRLTSDKDIKSGETVKIKKKITIDDLKDFSNETMVATAFFVVPVTSTVEIVSIKFDDGSVWNAK